MVLRQVERRTNGGNHICWQCRCDCGKIKIINGASLRAGATKSCGCFHKEVIENGHTRLYTNEERAFLSVFYNYRSRAKKLNIPFAITKCGFKHLVLQECFYCGKTPQIRDKKLGKVICNGIDRLDSSKGYVPGNMVPCCKDCNTMKMDMSLTQFLEKINVIGIKFGMWGKKK